MSKFGPKEGPCGWETHLSISDLEELHQILNCAAARGCGQCVRCSERALEKLLGIARRERDFGFLALDQLELDMVAPGLIGM